MKAKAFVQILPERDTEGRAERLKVVACSQNYPRQPWPGAIITRVVIDVPEEVANVQTVEAVAAAGALAVVVEAGDPVG